MREANKALNRKRHIIPTIGEFSLDLNCVKLFSNLYLLIGYHQLELDPESRYITTFSTYIGIYQYVMVISRKLSIMLDIGVSEARSAEENPISK
jgi:hypothetical protein